MKIPDLLPLGYSTEYIKTLIQLLGEEGIKAYLFPQLFLDFMYPGLFIWTYYIIIQTLSKKSKLFILPILAGLFDYSENIFLIVVLNGYINNFIIQLMSISTILKSIFTTLTFFCIIYFLIKIGLKKLRR